MDVWQARESKRNYCNLMMFLLFTLVYFCVLLAQRRGYDSYLVTEVMHNYMPKSNPLGGWSDVTQWIRESYVDEAWVNPDCGNALCEAPYEYPAWGEDNFHGCAVDCGNQTKLTAVRVVLDNTAPETGEWPCSALPTRERHRGGRGAHDWAE